jgi:lysophospholipase L1-like esterase
MTKFVTRRHVVTGLGGAVIAQAVWPSTRAQATASLPPLPLKSGAKVAFLGDSIIRRGHANPTPKEMSSYARGEHFWAKVYDQRCRIETWYDDNDPLGRTVSGSPKPGPGFNGANQGLDGDHSVAEFSVPGTLSRLPYVLARNPDIVLLHVGTNDINSGVDANTVIARLKQNLDAIRAAGKWSIISTIYPRSTSGHFAWPAGHRKWANRRAVNAFIKSLQATEGVVVFDPNPLLTDPKTASGEEEWLPGLSNDGVHPDPRGAQPAGEALAKLLTNLVSPGSVIETDPANSNLLAQAALSDTGGGKGAGVSGDVARGWNVSSSGALTVTCSKETAGQRIEKQILTINAGADQGGSARYDTIALNHPDITLANAGVKPDDWIAFGAFFEVSPWDGWISHCCQLSQRQGQAIQWVSFAGKPSNRATEIMPVTGFSGWWFSDPVRIVGEADRLRTSFVIEVLRGAVGAGSIKISRPFVRKVTDPRPAWSLG